MQKTNHIFGRISAAVLVETALLGRGLPSVQNEVISYLWPAAVDISLLWLERGKIQAGPLSHFLAVRGHKWPRINSVELEGAVERGTDGFLTVSALLRVAAAQPGEKRRLIVTSGLGGIRQEAVSADLHELPLSRDLLIASAFKDVLETAAGISYLRKQGARLLGWKCEQLDGFLYRDAPVPLDATLETIEQGWELAPRDYKQAAVLFNPLPHALRLQEQEKLWEALAAGDRARLAGQDFHPVVNEVLDETSNGCASLLQLLALLANLRLACQLHESWKEGKE